LNNPIVVINDVMTGRDVTNRATMPSGRGGRLKVVLAMARPRDPSPDGTNAVGHGFWGHGTARVRDVFRTGARSPSSLRCAKTLNLTPPPADMMHIPPGFNTLAPYLFTDDAPALVRFLIDGLGGVEVLRHMDGERIANAQVRLGTSTAMVSQASPEFPAMPASLYLFVENADHAMARALAAGARAIRPVADMPYGDRQGGVKDPCGNLWWLSQRLAAGPYGTSA